MGLTIPTRITVTLPDLVIMPDGKKMDRGGMV